MSNSGWSNQTNTRLIIVEGTPFSGLFFYSPSPAAGNLVGSWTAQAGTDPYGNAYPAGLQLVNGASSILLRQSGPILQQVYRTGNPSTLAPAFIEADTGGAGVSQFDNFEISGAQNSGNLDFAGLWLNSSSTDFTSQAYAALFYDVSPSGMHQYVRVSFLGGVISAGTIDAVDPATGTAPSNPAAPETWHTMSLLNGWSNVAGTTAAYRLLPTGDVQLIGNITGGTVGSGVSIASIASGYRPAHTVTTICGVSGNPAAPIASPTLQLDSTGNLSMHNIPAGTTGITFNHIVNLTW